MGLTEQADGKGKGKTWRKKQKCRVERKKAKKNPEVAAGYKKYSGYQT